MKALRTLVLGSLALAAVACSEGSAPPQAAELARQSSDEGGVTVEVAWNGDLASPTFDVAMDTHTLPLDGYDLSLLAVLRAGADREFTPLSWEAPKGGHHRRGTLRFPPLDAVERGSYIELAIRDVGGVPERTFRWKVN